MGVDYFSGADFRKTQSHWVRVLLDPLIKFVFGWMGRKAKTVWMTHFGVLMIRPRCSVY